MRFKVLSCLLVSAVLFGASKSDACSRILYVGDTTSASGEDVLRIVGRSLDWKTPIPTNCNELYIFRLFSSPWLCVLVPLRYEGNERRAAESRGRPSAQHPVGNDP